ncbi:MAG: biopolymer transporter ExbD [Halieaceae bacterium]
MSSKARMRRMARNHKRLNQQAKLSLVSLMDIFTILVFFLMVNSGDVEVLEADRNITLPDSVSEQKPEIALTIKIGSEDIIVQGRSVSRVADVLAQPGNVIEALGQELEYQSARAPALTELQQELGRQVIVMGDQDMPYKLLKRIMSTCAGSDYRDISLAVNSASVALAEEPLLAGGGD